MRNNDRLADLYYGRIHSPEAQQACRTRVHWLCQHAVGERVLDVGCSQGIVSIILGREGHRVHAIDIEEQAIQAANDALSHETAEVRERVVFTVADAFTIQLEEGSFDTVIAGELLEHLSNPRRLLERIKTWLRPGGRLVVTVPHGYEPFHDHKQTFYCLRLLALIAPLFRVELLEPVHDKYLGVVAARPETDEPPEALDFERVARWVASCEAALETVQRQEHHLRAALREKCRELSQERRALRDHIQAEKQLKMDIRESERALHKENAELKTKCAVLEQEIAEWKARVEVLADSMQEIEKVHRELDAFQRAYAEGLKLKEEVPRLQARVEEAEREAERLRGELQRVRDAKEQAERALESLRAKFEQARRAEAERTRQAEKAHSSELDRLRRELDNLRRRCTQAEARVSRLSERLETAKAELRLREQEIRYRVGDAMVRAWPPSWETLALPVRVVRLFVEGLKRRRARRYAEVQPAAAPKPAPAPPAPTGGTDRPAVDKPPAPEKQASGSGPEEKPGPASAGGEERVCTSLDAIPTLLPAFTSAPPELVMRPKLCLAGVMDEFSWRAWQFEADLYTFTPQNWRQALEARRPDLLLIESTWSGIDDSWYFQVRDLCQRPDAIKYYAIPDIIAWCRERGIPTVFYNKEDPPNFDVFIEAAKRFDYVFTSDANCIPDYRKYVGHERVYALPFAAQPRIHNPVQTGERTGNVCFAGTWYGHRHRRRQQDAHQILRPALDYDLHIFDRMANSGNPNYRWPDEYLSAVRGALPYSQVLSAYKRYKVFVNVNSVPDSPTMFSRRVFELLASGTPVISSYSVGIEQLLGADIVLMSEDEQTTRKLLERVLGDDQYRERLALRGQRKVFSEHTYTHRLERILEAVGLPQDPVGRPTLALVAAIERPEQIEPALQNYRRQDYARKRLLLCTNEPGLAEALTQAAKGAADIQPVVAGGELWGRVFRRVFDECPADFFLALNPGDHYGAHYLTDYAHATRYVVEPAIGKARWYGLNGSDVKIEGKGCEYRYVSKVYPLTLCLQRNQALACARRLGSARSPWEWWNRAARLQNRIYAPDRFNFVRLEPMPGAADAGAAPREVSPTRLEPASV